MNSVLFTGVKVEAGAVVKDSVLMPFSHVKKGAVVQRVIVADEVCISEDVVVGSESGEIELISQNV